MPWVSSLRELWNSSNYVNNMGNPHPYIKNSTLNSFYFIGGKMRPSSKCPVMRFSLVEILRPDQQKINRKALVAVVT
jgi:hypothetical protein